MLRVPFKDQMFVGIQFILFIIYLFDFTPFFEVSSLIRSISLAFTGIGVIWVILALLQLNESLSPFPTPKTHGRLKTHGLYKLVRHPIYSGIILSTISYGMYRGSSWKLSISVLLIILFYFKSEYEEKLLVKKFSEYSNYKKKTGRLWPKM